MEMSLSKFKDWAKSVRSVLSIGEMIRAARIRVKGHLSYYAITDNIRWCRNYIYRATLILYKWLNRKSQRRAYNMEQFNQVLSFMDWPRATIRKDLNPYRRAEAH